MLTILATLFTFGILILFHEFGHFLACKKIGVRVEKFSLGFGPKLFGFKRGETEYRLSAIPLGGYVKLAGDDPHEKLKGKRWEFLSRSIGARFLVIVTGPLANFVLAFFLFSLIFAVGIPGLPTEVGGVLKDTPAERAGLEIGDRIVAIEGKKVIRGEEMQRIVFANPDKELKFTIQRKSEKFTLTIIPESKKVKNLLGQEEKIGIIGITFPEELIKIRYGIGDAIQKGWRQTIGLTVLTLKGLGMLISGRVPLKSLAGPLFIAQAAGTAAQVGFTTLLGFIALFSVNLFVINLLPIPLLDGGHILFLALEGIRKKSLSIRAQEITQQIGLFIILLIFAIVIRNDIPRFIDWIRESIAR
ncbi:MAG TPA: RIP metalloprotease RseP [bacterium]|nr:RIP metalloprotease RseP [bacterium]